MCILGLSLFFWVYGYVSRFVLIAPVVATSGEAFLELHFPIYMHIHVHIS